MVGKIVTAGASLVFLTACGGGSSDGPVNGGGGSNDPIAFVLETFSDDAGVATGTDNNGFTFLAVATEVLDFVGAWNEVRVAPVEFDPAGYDLFLDSDNVYIREIDGEPTTLIVDEPRFDVGIFVIDSMDNRAFIVGGPASGALPSGSFSYSGTLLFGQSDLGIVGTEVGSFGLTGNFDTSTTVVLSGETDSYKIDGNASIDPMGGGFGGTELELKDLNLSVIGQVSLYGQLHGDAAESVSGVLHSNEAAPVFVGALVGSR